MELTKFSTLTGELKSRNEQMKALQARYCLLDRYRLKMTLFHTFFLCKKCIVTKMKLVSETPRSTLVFSQKVKIAL